MWHARLKSGVPPNAGGRAEASRLVAGRELSRTSTRSSDHSARSATPSEGLPRNGAAGSTTNGRLGRRTSGDRADGSAPGNTPLTADGTADDGSPGGTSQSLSHGGRVCADPADQRGCDQACGTKSRSHDVVLPFW